MDVRGFTLLELLVAMLVMVILTLTSVQIQRDWLPRQRVIAASNGVLGLIQRARARAYSRGPVYLCDGRSRCDRFDTTDRLLLAGAWDGEGQIDDNHIIERFSLPSGTTLTWNRFRGDALRYGTRGNLFYQNGHFLICNHRQALKIVINVLGTARIEPGDGDRCP